MSEGEKVVIDPDKGVEAQISPKAAKVVKNVTEKGIGEQTSTQDLKTIQRVVEAKRRIEQLKNNGR